MLEIIAAGSVIGALITLVALAHIDLKTFLLPNEWVLGFATTGITFQLCTLFQYDAPESILLGAFIGGGSLYVVRELSRYYYGEEALGLGDVKLMAAAGLWLGMDYILIGISLGALAGFIHGLYIVIHTRIKSQVKIDINKLSIPAGPGFVVGIIVTGFIKLIPPSFYADIWSALHNFLF